MSVQVNRNSTNLIYVNDKMVRLDSEGNWIASEELTTAKTKAFYEYLNSEKLDSKNRLN